VNTLPCALVAFCISATALFADALSVKLEANREERVASGETKLVPVEIAKPGEIIFYRAILANSSDAPINGVRPEIPIPVGMVMIAGSATPPAVEGSIDGKVFAALPLLDDQGKPLSANAIRSLRWAPSSIPPSATLVVGVQVTLAE
jgi:uncharacterized repeat protein (TIGR01451 family)